MATSFKTEYEAVGKNLKIDNWHAIPKIESITVASGVGKRRDDKKFVESVEADMARITGQKPVARKARLAIAGFKVRAGNLVGFQVTLRGKRKEDFLRRLIGVVLPRVRDFRGVPETSLDGQGNITIGINEQLAFPEIHPEQTDVVFGLQVTIKTSAGTNDEALVLLRALGFPLTSEKEE